MKQIDFTRDAEVLRISIDNTWSQFILHSIQKYYETNLHVDNEILNAFFLLEVTNEDNVKEMLYQVYLDELFETIQHVDI